MTPTEAVHLTDRIANLWPHQRMEEATPDAWYEAALHAIDLRDALTALNNLAGVNNFVSLAEILAEVRRIRGLRIAQRPINDPPAELTDDEAAYRALVKEATKRLGNGDGGAKVLAIGTGAPPNAEYNQARGVYRDPLRIAARKVACPWPSCQAPIGSSCTVGGRPMTSAPAHDGRLVSAGLAEWREIHGVQRIVLIGHEQDTP